MTPSADRQKLGRRWWGGGGGEDVLYLCIDSLLTQFLPEEMTVYGKDTFSEQRFVALTVPLGKQTFSYHLPSPTLCPGQIMFGHPLPSPVLWPWQISLAISYQAPHVGQKTVRLSVINRPENVWLLVTKPHTLIRKCLAISYQAPHIDQKMFGYQLPSPTHWPENVWLSVTKPHTLTRKCLAISY